jgi:hypothetical protein
MPSFRDKNTLRNTITSTSQPSNKTLDSVAMIRLSSILVNVSSLQDESSKIRVDGWLILLLVSVIGKRIVRDA